jgi:hypothetical protein
MMTSFIVVLSCPREVRRPTGMITQPCFALQSTATQTTMRFSRGWLPDENFAFVGDGEIAGMVAINSAAAGRKINAQRF